ncbi:MAG: Na(+)-translocating NADH-quinone reductase subunit A [Bacteroidales bacterium]
MSKVIKIKKGLNIPLEGLPEKVLTKADMAETYSVKPTDFPDITPKLNVQVGDLVKAGSPLFHDKNKTDIVFCSPVSGEVVEIRRGDRRVILEVVVKPTESIDYEQFDISDPTSLAKEQITSLLLKSGTWPYIRQRPYGIIANPTDTPKAIYISCFDTAPLAPDMDFSVNGEGEAFQAGIDALQKLTTGKIHLGLNADFPASAVFAKAKGVEYHYFTGPHPTGNVGVQIHHINPINKGDIVWVVNPLDVIIIGRLFTKGVYDATKVVALAGSEVKKPRYYRIISGARVDSIVKDNLTNSDVTPRIISGNVLTGTKLDDAIGFVGFYDNMITVIPEGNHHEFLGWMAPGFNKFSASRTFMSKFLPSKIYKLDTNFNGAERAYVLTGQYEKVLPMNIYPVYLIKAILANDIDKMEQLGIYEVVEEDLALCEYICTSKIEVQEILRSGIDSMIKELS